LQDLIDESSVGDVLDALRVLCLDKADYTRSQEQDERSASKWELAGNELTGFYAKFAAHFDI